MTTEPLTDEQQAALEPRGCPTPGACSAVHVIAGLKKQFTEAQAGIAAATCEILADLLAARYLAASSHHLVVAEDIIALLSHHSPEVERLKADLDKRGETIVRLSDEVERLRKNQRTAGFIEVCPLCDRRASTIPNSSELACIGRYDHSTDYGHHDCPIRAAAASKTRL